LKGTKEQGQLKQEIELVRKKLDNAIGEGYNEQTCYQLSVELDQLVEDYISMNEKVNIPVV